MKIKSNLFLLLSIFVFSLFHASCQRNQTSIISKDSKYKDPMFFIEGQLCQHARKLFQDSNDNLWIGTNIYGIMKYTGDTLQIFNRSTGHDFGRITGFLEDDRGHVWIASATGLYQYHDDLFKRYTSEHGLLDNELWSMIIDSKGLMWLGTQKGISIFDGKQFTDFNFPRPEITEPDVILSEDRMVSIVEDKLGNIWLGTDGFGLVKWDGKEFKSYTEDLGLCDNTISELFVDKKGVLWIGTFFGGLCSFDGSEFTNYSEEGKVYGVEVGAFFEDQDGSLWFAVENHGVYNYDGNEFQNYYKEHKLPTNGILTILKDRQNRFWFGGWGGLFRFQNDNFYPVTKNGPWN